LASIPFLFPESQPCDDRRTDAVPRPEYPRPQFVRQEWANLNGEWQFQTDDTNIGLEHGWFSRDEYAQVVFPSVRVVPSLLSDSLGLGVETNFA
jgi:hypothetical protein